VETLLRKYLWAIDCVAIAAIAILAARATSVGITSRFLGFAPASVRASPASAPADSRMPGKSASEIARRNIFCSTCPPPGSGSDTDEEAQPAGPQPTALPLRLMAIMYAPTAEGPRWSTAVIQDTLAFAGPYRVGDQVHGATVVDIRETRVYLDNAGRPEFLDLIGPSANPVAGATDPAAPAAPGATGASAAAAVVVADPVAVAPPAVPSAPRAAPAGTAKLFSVRGDRVARHPH
jgi:Type II secretion system protein C